MREGSVFAILGLPLVIAVIATIIVILIALI